MGWNIQPQTPHDGWSADEDLEAMFARFMTAPPIRQEVADAVSPGAAGGRLGSPV